MAKILYAGTAGTDDPTRASIPFVWAKGAVEVGHQPIIVLMGDASNLAQEANRNAVHGVGFPPLKELVAFALENNVPIYV